MKEYLFRGKRIDNGEWVEGYYVWSMGTTFIVHIHCVMPSLSDPGGEYFEKTHKVDPETVGQFTGLLDKNGQKIFDGDIKLWKFNSHRWVYQCYWSEIDNGYRWKMLGHNEKMENDHCEIKHETEQDYYNYIISCNQRQNGFDKFSEIIGNVHDNPELIQNHNNHQQ